MGDGVQREVFVCAETYYYNFSVGRKNSTRTSGPDRLRRSAGTCEASAPKGKHAAPPRFKYGDQVACWRPVMQLEDTIVERFSCGRPVCTAADVYSCGDIDCVQLSDPAEQFVVLYKKDVALVELGWYSMSSGCFMALALFAAECRAPEYI